MTKDFYQDGKWIEKPTKTVVHECKECKGRFIKSRNRQTMCLPCLNKDKFIRTA